MAPQLPWPVWCYNTPCFSYKKKERRLITWPLLQVIPDPVPRPLCCTTSCFFCRPGQGIQKLNTRPSLQVAPDPVQRLQCYRLSLRVFLCRPRHGAAWWMQAGHRFRKRGTKSLFYDISTCFQWRCCLCRLRQGISCHYSRYCTFHRIMYPGYMLVVLKVMCSFSDLGRLRQATCVGYARLLQGISCHYSRRYCTFHRIMYPGYMLIVHSSGAVWESRWPSWAVRPNEPSGFRGRKAVLNHASALVSACP